MRPRRGLAAFCLVAALLAAGDAYALTYAGHGDNIAYVPVHQMGYDGSGVVIGIIDASFPLPNHVTFHVSDDCTASRVTRMDLYGGDSGTGPIGHANSVAGIAAGRGPGDGTYLGVAPAAEIWSASCSSDEVDIRQAFLDFTTPDNAGKSCQVFVMSLAAITEDDGSLPFVKFFDWLAVERGALVSFGAGNGTDGIWVPGGNYNHLTVGALDQALTQVGNLSGRGPTPDGRSKPDVVAPGTNVHLPAHTGVDDWGQDQSGNSFTSVAAPFGAGVSALIRQYGDDHGMTWDPRVIPGIFL